ncbi:MAG: protealysin inhibitor emfourin [Pirellulales bacterium]
MPRTADPRQAFSMRITFMLSGGFVGSIRGCRIDTATLPDADRGDVEHLVEASGLTESFERFTPTGRDLRHYDLAIEWATRLVRVSCDEASLPDPARPLIGFLATRAVPQPLTFTLPEAAAVPRETAGGTWGRFIGDVVATWGDDGRDMTLVEPFAYLDPQDVRWDAPTGAVVNGASIPQAFWSLIGGPFEGRFRNASVVHDVACEVRDRPWQSVHRMFYEACRCGGVGAVKATTMYYAVSHFGPRWRVEERRSVVAGEPQVERIVYDESPPPPTAAEVRAVAHFFTTHEVAADAVPTLRIPPVTE